MSEKLSARQRFDVVQRMLDIPIDRRIEMKEIFRMTSFAKRDLRCKRIELCRDLCGAIGENTIDRFGKEIFRGTNAWLGGLFIDLREVHHEPEHFTNNNAIEIALLKMET